MKKIITVLFAILFAVLSLTYTGMQYAEMEAKRLTEIVVLNEVEKNMAMVMEKANEFVPFDYEAQLDKMLENIQKDESVDAFVEEYADVVLDDLLLGQASGRLDLNTEAEKISELYLNDMAELTSDIVRPEIQREVLKDLLSQVDLNAQYDQAIQKISPKISHEQKDILRQSKWFLNHYRSIERFLLLGMGLLLIFAFLINFGLPSSIRVVSVFSFLTALVHFAFYWLLSIGGNRFLRPYQISLEPKVFSRISSYGFALFLLTLVLNYFVSKNKAFHKSEDMRIES